jgi:hypothetical protein
MYRCTDRVYASTRRGEQNGSPRILYTQDQRRHQHLHSSGIRRASGRRCRIRRASRHAAVSATPVDTASEDGSLTSSFPSRGQSSGGALWRTILFAPAHTCVHACSKPVHTLYINAYVIWNKLVLL